MDKETIASGNILQATFDSDDDSERLPFIQGKLTLKRWQLISLMSLSYEEAEQVQQKLELYAQKSSSNKINGLGESIISLKRIKESLHTEGILNALFKADSINSLMIIAHELMIARKERRSELVEKLASEYALPVF